MADPCFDWSDRADTSSDGGASEELLAGQRAIGGAATFRRLASRMKVGERRHLLQLVIRQLVQEGRQWAQAGVKTVRTEVGPYRRGREIDLDLSLDVLVNQAGFIGSDDLRVWQRTEARRAFAVMLDYSRSLSPYAAHVALALGILMSALEKELYSIIVFNRAAQVYKDLLARADGSQLLARTLETDCGGATDLHQALQLAGHQLHRAPPGMPRIGVLISDCIPTKGEDPLALVPAFAQLHVLYLPTAEVIGKSVIARLETFKNVHVRKVREFNEIVDGIKQILTLNKAKG